MAYSDAEKAEVIIRLAVNRYDFKKTAEETGLPVMTLRRWNKNVPKKGVADLLERAIERMLMVIPEKMSGQEWAVALGILMDKWLLIHGQATVRTENILRTLEQLSDNELDDLLREFEEAARRGLAGPPGEGQAETPGHDTATG